MNAPTTLAPPPGVRHAEAHLFRSQLIELMAKAEQIITGHFRAADKPIPHLSGQKLEAARVQSLGDGNQARYALLSELQAYCDLRSTICHAELSRPGGPYFCFRPVADTGVKRWRPVLLTAAEMASILSEAGSLIDRLAKS